MCPFIIITSNFYHANLKKFLNYTKLKNTFHENDIVLSSAMDVRKTIAELTSQLSEINYDSEEDNILLQGNPFLHIQDDQACNLMVYCSYFILPII